MFKINMENVWIALEIMGKGMVGIFIALAIVYLMVLLLTKVFPPKEDENKEKE